MIIEKTTDLALVKVQSARIKVNTLTFVRKILQNYNVVPAIRMPWYKQNMVVSPELRSAMDKNGYSDVRVVGMGPYSPVKNFLFADKPHRMEILINPLQIEVQHIRLTLVKNGRSDVDFTIKKNFKPFRYGLELLPVYKDKIEWFFIDKSIGWINFVFCRDTQKSMHRGHVEHYNETENMWEALTLEYALSSNYSMSEFHLDVNRRLKGYTAFQSPIIYVKDIGFTEPLPIEEEIMPFIGGYS